MSELVNKNSRNSSSVQIADGTTYPIWVGGDFFYVLSASGTLTVSVNGGPFTPLQVGLIHSGVVGRDDIGEIKFANASGTAVDLVVVFGKGKMEITGQTTLLPGGSVALTPATIAALNPVALDTATLAALETIDLASATQLAITPAQQTLTPDFYDVTTNGVSLVAKKAVKLENVGGASATITIGGGTPRTLASGRSVDWSIWRHQDKFATIVIDALGTTVQVTELA